VTLLIATINIGVIFGCSFLLWRRQHQEITLFFWPALTIKLLAGIAIGLIYKNYYVAGDTFILFDQARSQTYLLAHHPADFLDFLWRENVGEWKGVNRSTFLIKIISIFNILSVNNYWITSLWFSFISFLGAWYFFKKVTRFFTDAKLQAAFAFLFFPSVVFWSSGIIKESLSLAGLFFLAGVYLEAMMGKTPTGRDLVYALLGFVVLWNLKYYWVAVFLPVTITSCIVQYSSVRLRLASVSAALVWVVVFFLLVLAASLIHPNFYPGSFLRVLVENNSAFTAISDPSNLVHYNSLSPSWWSVVINVPWALISGLFRPFVWEADNVWKMATAFENVWILVLFLSSLVHVRDFLSSPNKLLTLSVVVYVLSLCVFLALSTPNLGSLARYKVGFMPFFIFLITYKNPLVDAVLSVFVRKLKSS
jgi:hypothetical protein